MFYCTIFINLIMNLFLLGLIFVVILFLDYYCCNFVFPNYEFGFGYFFGNSCDRTVLNEFSKISIYFKKSILRSLSIRIMIAIHWNEYLVNIFWNQRGIVCTFLQKQIFTTVYYIIIVFLVLKSPFVGTTSPLVLSIFNCWLSDL